MYILSCPQAVRSATTSISNTSIVKKCQYIFKGTMLIRFKVQKTIKLLFSLATEDLIAVFLKCHLFSFCAIRHCVRGDTHFFKILSRLYLCLEQNPFKCLHAACSLVPMHTEEKTSELWLEQLHFCSGPASVHELFKDVH